MSHFFKQAAFGTKVCQTQACCCKGQTQSSSHQREHENDYVVGARIKPGQYRAKSPIVPSLKFLVLDLRNQFAILETMPNDIVANVEDGVVILMVEEHIEDFSL